MEPNQGEQTADKPEVADVKPAEVSAQVTAPAAAPVAADVQPSGNAADANNKKLAASKPSDEKKPVAAATPVKPVADSSKPDAGASTQNLDMNKMLMSMIAAFIAPLMGKTPEEFMEMMKKKPAENKAAETKPVVAGGDKPAGGKPTETKPSETKPAVAGADGKPVETKLTSNEPALVGPPKPAELEPGFVGPIKPDVVAVSPTQDELAGLGASPVVEEAKAPTKESPALAALQPGAVAQGNSSLIADLAKGGNLPGITPPAEPVPDNYVMARPQTPAVMAMN